MANIRNMRSDKIKRIKKRSDGSDRSRPIGFLLLGAGCLGLLLTLMFSGLPALSGVPAWLAEKRTQAVRRVNRWIYGPEKAASPWDFSDVKPLEELKAVPSAQGWSALDSFYAAHPPVEGEEEYYLDPALWREPARKGGAVQAAGVPVHVSGTGDTSMTVQAPSRRNMGVWTGPSDGLQMVDTSIRPAQEQLRRQGAMPLQAVAESWAGDTVAADSSAGGSGLVTVAETASLDVSAAEGGLAAGLPDAAHAAVPAGGSGQIAEQKEDSGEADKPTSQKPLHVEFWESPVHYKGYQLNGNNLILYGINEADSLRFENHPDGIWMYHKAAVYRLKTSTEMQRFELISGEETPVGGAAEASETEASGGGVGGDHSK